MKKSLEILLALLPGICLIASFTNIRVRNEVPEVSVIRIQKDTSIANKWIKIDPFELSIIPPSSGVQFYREGILFLTSSKYEDKMAENHISFGRLDARYATISDSVPGNIKEFSLSVPFPYPCEAVTFTSNYDTMYYTKYSAKDGVEKIFEAVYSPKDGKEDTWTFSDEPLSFCTGRSTYTHPALSRDGRLIVFASNREGSTGGTDLYASLKKKGSWSDPVNLGDAVNSTANEQYPFLDSENNLFFSSDGTQGFGGYDIYACKFKGNTWEKPVNLSSSINTRYDDVAFTIGKKDSKTAFYTVKNFLGKGSQQLFKVTMKESITGTVLNLTQFFTRPDISQMVILALEPAVQASDKASETATLTRGEKDTITYRVQFLTSFNPRTRERISVDGKDYRVYEFLYSGAYRLCIGESGSLSAAIELRNLLKKSEYPQATVIAFKNNVISLDPELLKEPPVLNTEVKTVKGISDTSRTMTASEAVVTADSKNGPTANDAGNNSIVKHGTTGQTEKKMALVYRVQIQSNTSSKGNHKIPIANEAYDTFEYQYAGAYRICVGEFSSLSDAMDFQKTCRQNGYAQAFVVAFRNNTRTNDPSLFR